MIERKGLRVSKQHGANDNRTSTAPENIFWKKKMESKNSKKTSRLVGFFSVRTGNIKTFTVLRPLFNIIENKEEKKYATSEQSYRSRTYIRCQLPFIIIFDLAGLLSKTFCALILRRKVEVSAKRKFVQSTFKINELV